METGVMKIIMEQMHLVQELTNLIIHFNFPLSFGQYVKENERVCRDGTKAKGVIFYSKGELKFLYGIILEKREYIGYEETLEIHTKQIIY